MLEERERGTTPFKRRQPSDPCSHAPSLTQTQTNVPTAHFHSAPYLQPRKNKGSKAFSAFCSAWLLHAPGIRPCTSFALSCHLEAEGFTLTTLTQQCFPGILLRTSVHQGPPWLPSATHISKEIKHFGCQTQYHPDIHRAAEGCDTACSPLQSDNPITGVFIPCSLLSQML